MRIPTCAKSFVGGFPPPPLHGSRLILPPSPCVSFVVDSQRFLPSPPPVISPLLSSQISRNEFSPFSLSDVLFPVFLFFFSPTSDVFWPHMFRGFGLATCFKGIIMEKGVFCFWGLGFLSGKVYRKLMLLKSGGRKSAILLLPFWTASQKRVAKRTVLRRIPSLFLSCNSAPSSSFTQVLASEVPHSTVFLVIYLPEST